MRHPSWFCPEVGAILRAHGAALVIGDRRGPDLRTHAFTSDWAFVRFHFGTHGRRGNYSRAELEGWADRLAGWRREVEVFAYPNNDMGGFAPRNAVLLRRLLAGR